MRWLIEAKWIRCCWRFVFFRQRTFASYERIVEMRKNWPARGINITGLMMVNDVFAYNNSGRWCHSYNAFYHQSVNVSLTSNIGRRYEGRFRWCNLGNEYHDDIRWWCVFTSYIHEMLSVDLWIDRWISYKVLNLSIIFGKEEGEKERACVKIRCRRCKKTLRSFSYLFFAFILEKTDGGNIANLVARKCKVS